MIYIFYKFMHLSAIFALSASPFDIPGLVQISNTVCQDQYASHYDVGVMAHHPPYKHGYKQKTFREKHAEEDIKAPFRCTGSPRCGEKGNS